ncbi:pyocin knob domain-containing protein [Abiotrophia defectiva]|uniref:pyocin knob domain-containing protein n=1 Tax=Abiotrophia defectiva TaxID=46125 RepID=UPI0028E98E3E|nr:pyocin knob domain-containing protein [Abiotrophia defectiva]
MTLPRLQLTDIGSKEMAKQGDLVITRVAFGSRFSGYATIKTTTAMGSELSSVSPTVREEQGFRVIDIVYDNSQLNSANSIKEIGVFAKIGNGSEFLAYYGADNIGVEVPAKNNQSYTLRLKFKIKLTGRDNITVEVNPNISGLATSDSVNQIAGKVDKLKNGASIEETLDLAGLKVLLGSTGKQRAPQDLDALGTPGLYWYEQSHNAPSKGIASGYGFVIVYSNMVGSLGQAGNWTWQIYTATNGRMWVRYKINQDPWKVQGVASGEYLTSLFKRLGLDEWGAGFNITTCSSGTNFGTFLASNTVPIGFNIVKDNNAPAKTVYVWKQSNSSATCFAPMDNGSFLLGSLVNGRFGEWRDLSQGLTVQTSPNQDFGDYLRSSAVPIGLSAQKDSRTGAFGQVTKVDNNNVFFSGALREQGKTYQVAYAVVDGVKPSAFTKWPLT